jgi:hypothetical protein
VERGERIMQIKTAMLDGKRVAYHDMTEFFVQVGKGSKGSYKTRYKIVGNLSQAVLLYTGINIGNGYKKRLYVPSFNKATLAREAAY